MRTFLRASTLFIALTLAFPSHAADNRVCTCWNVGLGFLTTCAGAGIGSLFGSWATNDKDDMPTVYGALIGGATFFTVFVGAVALNRCARKHCGGAEASRLVYQTSSDTDT